MLLLSYVFLSWSFHFSLTNLLSRLFFLSSSAIYSINKRYRLKKDFDTKKSKQIKPTIFFFDIKYTRFISRTLYTHLSHFFLYKLRVLRFHMLVTDNTIKIKFTQQKQQEVATTTEHTEWETEKFWNIFPNSKKGFWWIR